MYISATKLFAVKLVRINYEKVNIKSECASGGVKAHKTKKKS